MSLVLHEHNKHPMKNEEGQLICTYAGCGKIFTTGVKPLLSHIRIVHFDHQPFQCPECPKKFDLQFRLNDHMKLRHTDEENFLCDKCDARFNNRAKLTVHKKNKHDEGTTYVCTFCGKCYKYKTLLDTHVKHNHEQPGEHVCDQCGKVYISEKLLKEHKKRHDVQPGSYFCPKEGCGKEYTLFDSLRAHLKRVHGPKRVKKYTCHYCPKKFELKSSRQEHENCMHLNVKDFKCDHCDYASARKSALTSHVEIIHKGVTFECDYPGCSKSYGLRGNLYAHRFRVHKIPRPKQS